MDQNFLVVLSVHRPVVLSVGLIIRFYSAQNSYLRSIFEKHQTQTANACSTYQDVRHGLSDAELGNHR